MLIPINLKAMVKFQLASLTWDPSRNGGLIQNLLSESVLFPYSYQLKYHFDHIELAFCFTADGETGAIEKDVAVCNIRHKDVYELQTKLYVR
jgi:hypothetical protein